MASAFKQVPKWCRVFFVSVQCTGCRVACGCGGSSFLVHEGGQDVGPEDVVARNLI